MHKKVSDFLRFTDMLKNVKLRNIYFAKKRKKNRFPMIQPLQSYKVI